MESLVGQNENINLLHTFFIVSLFLKVNKKNEHYHYYVELIRNGVGAVLEDKGFRLPSIPACSTTALNTASQLVEWMSKLESEEELGTFSISHHMFRCCEFLLQFMTYIACYIPQSITFFICQRLWIH